MKLTTKIKANSINHRVEIAVKSITENLTRDES